MGILNDQFIGTVSYTKQLDNGALKRVKEDYLVHEHTFGAAEESLYHWLDEVIRGEFNVVGIKRGEFEDIIISDDDAGTFFEMTAKYEGLDSDSGKAKTSKHKFLITAYDLEDATGRLKTHLVEIYGPTVEVISGKVSPIWEEFQRMPSEEERTAMRIKKRKEKQDEED